MNIQIENFRKENPLGPVMAIFDVVYEDLILSDWKLIKSKKGFIYVSEPSLAKKDEFGELKWIPAVRAKDAETKKEISNQIMELLKPLMRYDL